MAGLLKKLNICVFAPEIHDTISQDVVTGIISRGKLLGVNISIVAAGGVNMHDRMPNEDSRLYRDVLELGIYDGIIALTGSFSNHATYEEVVKFFKFIPDDYPLVNISIKIPGFPALLTDNVTPIKKMISHLIDNHNKKRFMFIKGPEGQSEAYDRYKGFVEVLESKGIDLYDELIFEGSFSPQAGSKAVRSLINSGLELPDAIICADDDTALGVYSELKKQNINILEENISVTGFDNMEYTKSMTPSLTTIDQSFVVQGQRAVDAVVDLIKSGDRKDIYYEPKLVIRESCGCDFGQSYDGMISQPDDSETFTKIYSTMEETEVDGLESHIDEIMSSVYKFVDDSEFNFFKTIDKYIDMYTYKGYNVKTLSDIIGQLNRMVIPQLKDDHLLKYLQVIESVDSKIIDTVTHERIRDYRSFSEQSSELDAILMHLATCYTYNELVTALERNFFYLGIKDLSFTFFGDQNGDINHMLRDLTDRDLSKDDSLNRSLKSYCTLYLPIFTKSNYGFCKLKIIQSSFHIAEVLSFQISKTLYLIELLNDLNDKIFELETSYRDLRETKELLLESEQLANLGGLVAGFTHEINSPIGVGVTATSHIQEITNNITKLFNSNSMKKSDLDNYFNVVNESLAIVMTNLNRTASLIHGFKQIAVDQASEILRSFEIGSYIKEIVHSLTPILKPTKHSVTVNIDKDIYIESYPGAISQILTNLIQNSLKHGFESVESGNITFNIYSKDESLFIEYSDDGCGIKDGDIDKIFESYYSTKIGQGGSGLGLAIIKELVETKLKGSISCESKEDEGIKFTLICPIELSSLQ